VIGVLLIVVATVVVVRKTLFRDRARAVSTVDALNRFRSESATTAPPTTSVPPITATAMLTLPAPGVYRYATEGEESVDVLGGATHTYPPETTITVTADGCGVLFRWDALQERRDEWRLCATKHGLVQGNGLQYHEFFGQAEPEDVVCPARPVMVPAVVEPGPATEVDCTLESDPWTVTWQVIGREARPAGDTTVDTVHVRQSVNDTAALGEQSTVDWYLDDHGLPIYVTATKRSTSSSPIGTVLYQEHYTLSLESQEPAR
jgi:hypothetical protein